MKAYPVYKKSEIRWIGNIPNHWEVIRVKHSDIVIMGQSPNSNDYNLEDIGLPFLQGNADFTKLHPRPRVWCDTANKIAEKDDVLVSVRAPIGSVNIADQAYGIGRGLCAIRSNTTFSTLLFYFFIALNEELNSIGTGSTYTAISVDDVKNTHILKIPPPEQHAISDFLDRKTAQIDTLIEKKQRQIELLQEHRTSLINQAVTRGLNPDAPMKDSDIEWLGEIPEHWEVKKLKWLANVTLSNIDKKTKDDEPKVELCNYTDVYYYEHISQSIDFMRASASRSQINRLSLQAGDVLITKDSETPDDIAVPAYVPETLPGVVCGYHLSHLRSYTKEMRGKYLFRSFQANGINDQFQFSAKGITRFGISKYIIENALFLQPPLHEQRAIADFLDHGTAIIDHNVMLTNKEINLLQEYRTALISAAVTGKIDVRE